MISENYVRTTGIAQFTDLTEYAQIVRAAVDYITDEPEFEFATEISSCASEHFAQFVSTALDIAHENSLHRSQSLAGESVNSSASASGNRSDTSVAPQPPRYCGASA